MNIVERGKRFVQWLHELADRKAWEWRRCPHCGDTWTCKHGTYVRRPWFLDGQREVQVQRHGCHRCQRTYSEGSALLVRGGWYSREVRRKAVDLWQHGGSSLRRVAEWLRSEMGRQERWLMWRPLEEEPAEGERCHLGASSVHRWLDCAGRRAQESVVGQLEGVGTSGQMGTDGLWARLRHGARRVVLILVDSASGLVYPPVVAGSEEEASWKRLFERAREAGLDLDALRGVTSDGVNGLIGCLMEMMEWVNHQRCVWHLWRNLGGKIAWRVSRAATGLAGEAAKVAREEARKILKGLVHSVLDAASYEEAERALAQLMNHLLGVGLGRVLRDHLDAALMYLGKYNSGLMRVSPEWCWRDYRLRLSRGRNQGSESGWSEGHWCGPSTGTSPLPNRGQRGSGSIGDPARVHWKWPECLQEGSVTWMP